MLVSKGWARHEHLLSLLQESRTVGAALVAAHEIVPHGQDRRQHTTGP